LNLTYGEEWLPDIGDIFTAASQAGHRINCDVNDGDPIGMGMGSVCIEKGIRATSASAYLSQPPLNLEIIVNAPVARVLFSRRRAIGVECVHGRHFMARKQVIISAGALNTPQILKCSGIGPANELKRHGIPLVQELPMVGENLQDHCFSTVGIVLEKNTTLHTGPRNQCPTPMGWFKMPSITSSSEFQHLPIRIQEHMRKPTVPAIEMATVSSWEVTISKPLTSLQLSTSPFLASEPIESESCFGAICLIMNPQSKGTVTLQSSDPSQSPLIDPKFLTHPFDRRTLIDGIREVMRVLRTPIFATRTLKTLGPANKSDEAIWKHVKNNLRSSWHMSCTATMGKDEKKAVVNSKFKVFGVSGLSIVDLSVCPFVINAHTQSTAYILGEIGAEALADEYELGEIKISGKPRMARIGKL
jgi:choline dehydrogenase-like flavoprotein